MIPHAPHAPRPRTILAVLVAAAILGSVACEIPECIDGPSNLTPEATASCVAPPADVPPAEGLKSAAAELRGDGTLVLTWTSWSLTCGLDARDFEPRDDCADRGWAFSLELPPALAVPGVIALAEHPDLVIHATVIDGGDGAGFGNNHESPFVGEVELVGVGDGCVSGVLRGFGSGRLDPVLGGPELDGSFLAPRC